jgi:hypothetical protein
VDTEYETVPAPWPLDPEVIFSHPASLVAFHAQSLVVATVSDPLAPAAGAVPIKELSSPI